MSLGSVIADESEEWESGRGTERERERGKGKRRDGKRGKGRAMVE